MPEVPKGWMRNTFGEILIQRGEYARGDERLLSVTADLGVIPQELAGRRDISNPNKRLYRKVYPGDVVYNTMRMWQGVSGVANLTGIVSPAYTVCTPIQEVDSDFLGRILKYSEYVRVFRAYSQGLVSDTWNLRFSSLAKLPVSLPSRLSEQRRIAEILDAVDEQIAAVERTITKKQLVEVSLVAQAWQGPKASENWRVRRLDELASVEAGLTLGVEPSGPSSVMLPYLRVANVQNGYIDTTEMKTVRVLRSQIERYAVKAGDVLLTEGGDFDKLGRGAMWDGRIAPCLHQNHIFRVRCRRAFILPDFLAMHIASPAGRQYFLGVAKQTTNLASINSTQLKAMPVPVPPVEEQERLLKPVRAARQELTHEEAELRKLRLLKEGLMDDLLSGRVRATRRGELTG